MAEYGDGRSTSSRDALSAIALRFIDEYSSFVCSMNHIPSYLFLSRQDDDNVGDIGEHDFRSAVLDPILGSLSTHVFEPRTATGSALFSLLTCFHTTTFTLLSIFSPLEMISTKIWETPLSWHVKCSLPVAVRVSKTTRVLKLPLDCQPTRMARVRPTSFPPSTTSRRCSFNSGQPDKKWSVLVSKETVVLSLWESKAWTTTVKDLERFPNILG